MSEPKLLPCPFCGPVEIVHTWAGNVRIKHKDTCFIRTMTTLYGNVGISAWNRRAEKTADRPVEGSVVPADLKIEERDVVRLYAVSRELGLFADKFNRLVSVLRHN